LSKLKKFLPFESESEVTFEEVHKASAGVLSSEDWKIMTRFVADAVKGDEKADKQVLKKKSNNSSNSNSNSNILRTTIASIRGKTPPPPPPSSSSSSSSSSSNTMKFYGSNILEDCYFRLGSEQQFSSVLNPAPDSKSKSPLLTGLAKEKFKATPGIGARRVMMRPTGKFTKLTQFYNSDYWGRLEKGLGALGLT